MSCITRDEGNLCQKDVSIIVEIFPIPEDYECSRTN